REAIRRSLWFALALAGTLLAVFLFFDRPALLDQVVRFRSQTRSDLLLPRPTNWRSFLVYAGQLWGLALPALAGLVVSVRSTRGQAWGLWLLANFALLMWYNPVFPHHFSLLLAPAILLAVEFVRFTIYELRITDETFPLAVKRVAWGVSGVIVVAALANLPAWVSANRATAAIVTGGREAEAARMLARVTRPADFVMSDSLLLALYAGRRTPPPLADISLVYIQTGRQTPEGLVAMSGIYSVTAVAPWALRMVWLPEYLDWAEQNFWVKKVWDNDHILFFGPKHPADRPIPNAQKTPFAGGVILSGYSLDAGPVAPGDSLPLTLYWRTAAPLQTDYTVFVHLLSGEGKLVAQHDGGPIYGYLPTTQWPVGEIIPDRLEIPLPADLPAGEYTLIAGMYNPHTLERLNRPDAAQDFAPLTTVAIR
ncbi:MAG: hypothetical protein ACE5G8_00960, partial [Anaerolineae bacterium]